MDYKKLIKITDGVDNRFSDATLPKEFDLDQVSEFVRQYGNEDGYVPLKYKDFYWVDGHAITAFFYRDKLYVDVEYGDSCYATLPVEDILSGNGMVRPFKGEYPEFIVTEDELLRAFNALKNTTESV